jgi:Tetratricopeptide repeat
VLKSQGKYDEAEAMHRRALELRQTVLGKEHPGTLTSMNNLALVLESQGKYYDASTLCQQAFSGFRKTLGEGHPTTLACSKNYTAILEEYKLSGEEGEA